MEHKTLHFKSEGYDEESGIFSGYASISGNIDEGGDIVEPGAFEKTLNENFDRIKILALHNDSWLPIGKPLELKEDSSGLYIKAKISDTSMGKDIKVLLKDGVLNELSIGYDPVVFEYDSEGIRHLREVKLWEVSVVTWAMNPEAVITSYKKLSEETSIKELKRLSAEMKEAIKAIDGFIVNNADKTSNIKPTTNLSPKAKKALLQAAKSLKSKPTTIEIMF